MRGVKAVLSLAAIAALLLIGIAYMAFGVLRFDPTKSYTDARMLLGNSGGLAPGTPVLLTGVHVGSVTGVDKVADGVEVRFRIDDAFKIPTASAVRIENLSALGEPYVEFEPTSDSGPYLENGQLVETRNIDQPITIPQVSVKVVEVLQQFDPEAVSSIIGTFEQGLAGTDAVVPVLERSSKLLAATILSRRAVIEGLLVDAQSIAGDMGWVGPSLTETGPQWAAFGGLVDDILTKAAPFVQIPGTPGIYENGDGLVPVLTLLTSLVNKVGPGIAELTPVVQPFAADLNRVAPQVDISDLLAQALGTVGDDGALHVQITVK